MSQAMSIAQQRYNHVLPEDMHGAPDKVEQMMESIIGGDGWAAERFNEYASGEAMAAFLETEQGVAYAWAWARRQVLKWEVV
ncbi:hypothetical protein [Halomonas sp. WWR20]